MSARPPLPTRRTFLAQLNPQDVLRLIDDGIASPSPYAALYDTVREAVLDQHSTNARRIAGLLAEMDDGDCVEGAFREAGFVLGFEVCRHLLLGELDLDALTQRDAADAPEQDGAR